MVLPGMTFQQYAEFTQLPSGTLLERGGDLYRIP
jgi:hypothetical protein